MHKQPSYTKKGPGRYHRQGGDYASRKREKDRYRKRRGEFYARLALAGAGLGGSILGF